MRTSEGVIMKQLSLLVLCGLLLWPVTGLAAAAPHSLGGFVLGGEIDQFYDKLLMDTELPIRHLESLKEVEIKAVPGFKTGLVYYTTCLESRRIIRLKLKFADESMAFFDRLIASYKKSFGDPLEWRGDPFGVVIAWKWSFTDQQNNKISLILTHNTRDSDEKMGSYVKMTMTNLMEDEMACFERKHPQPPEPQGSGKIDRELFIPK
jgi:hypothetical protein